jgi:hypothetical protein
VLLDGKLTYMNEQKNSPTDFEADYRTLKLKESADWSTTLNHYRRLVHTWHPDKYTDKPLELDSAQKQFIALSKSYNRLKEFHALHKRLPFQHTKPEKHRLNATVTADPVTASKKSNVDPNNLDLGALSRDKNKVDERLVKKNPLSKILWSVIAITVVVGTIMLFFILDQKANLKNMERGRQVLKDAPQSEFTPTPSEIRRSESKGAFIRIPD